MPTRKPRADTPVEDPAVELATAPENTEEETPPQAVVVVKVVDQQGNISTDVQPINGLLPTEVQTLLELGIVGWREKIGLGRSSS